MGCVDRGELRAYLDGELAAGRGALVESHLASCDSCRQECEALGRNASFARSAMDGLAPLPSQLPMPRLSGVRDVVRRGEMSPVTPLERIGDMMKNLARNVAGSKMRLAGAALASLVLVGLLFTLSPVQTLASGFLSIFRVQKFVAVTVDPSSLPDLTSPEQLGSFSTTGSGKPRTVSVDEASKDVGFRVAGPTTLPAGLEPTPRSVVAADGYTISYVPDMEKVNRYLATIGATDVKLPARLDGATITLQMPPSAQLLYLEKGAVDRSADGKMMPRVGQKFLFLGMTTSPTLTVPDGIDLEQVRTELLKIPGLPADLVSQLKSIQDWKSTVVVPVVKGTSRDVTVQGEKGLLVTSPDGQGRHLVWLKGGVVYAMSGSVSEAEIIAAAESIK